MNAARPTTEEQRLALKMATQIVVNLCGGGKIAAQLTAVDAPTLSLNGARHEENRFMRIDVALDLDLAAGEPVIARALAAAQGFALVRDGAADAANRPLNLEDYGHLHREAFEANTAVFQMAQSSTRTAADKHSALKELADLRKVIAQLEAKIESE